MMYHKQLTSAFGAILLLMLAVACSGPSEKQSTSGEEPPASTANLAFWDYAASTNMLQAQLGQIASEKAQSKPLRKIGEEEEDFNNKALQKLKRLVRKQPHIQLPDSLGGADQEIVYEFRSLQDTEFNSRYRSFLVSSHESQLAWYEDALRDFKDPALRRWVYGMQEHLREQLQEIAKTDSTQVQVSE
ncbi:DUF4142 domain-containing protein [Pontibacter silvestris]|uniref:DUF4142 domain-containing protein n=1 Tax=Pontibacter silvestris TaxID=2305183 RepID=A0ABW4X596_9BACT|nr:DUF4142 domain-containing protein [Pontibacter silvestris]MCC9137129.1 DUF4142 domain-containing protein [Pontibacter silvestris]